MNEIIFKNKSSKDFNITVESIGRRQRAEEEIEIHDIPYRDGVLTTRSGKYKTYERSIGIAVKDQQAISKVNAWLTGSGRLETSIDEGGFFKAECINGLEYSRIIRRWNRFYASFLIQPFFYLYLGEVPIELDGPSTIFNPGTHYSEPLIKIIGSGDITLNINDRFIELEAIGPSITIDSDLQIVYRDTQNLDHKMEGDFPIFKIGENNISWEGNLTRLEMVPRWREL